MEDAKEILENKKSELTDPFGIHKKELDGNEYNQLTEYDGFIFEDSLRIISAGNDLNNIKAALEPRMNKETGLYEITVGDINSQFYNFATMFNRMTNETYFKKVYRSANLLKDIFHGIKKDYTNMVEKSISQVKFDEGYEDNHFSK